MEATTLRELTAEIISAYISKNAVQRAALPEMVGSVAAALAGLRTPAQPEKPVLVPPVSIKKSVTPDYLISLEDGKRYKSMKRHLSARAITPAEYREKWGLPHDYPMVAPNYAAARSEMAKTMGLGRRQETKAPSGRRKKTR